MRKIARAKDGMPRPKIINNQLKALQQGVKVCAFCHREFIPLPQGGKIVCSYCRQGASGCCG